MAQLIINTQNELNIIIIADNIILESQANYAENCSIIIKTDLSKLTYQPHKFYILFQEQNITHELKVSNSHCDLFKNENMIATLNFNNKLEWIADWTYWHYKKFNITSVVIADNNSTLYTCQELLDFLNSLPWINKAVVIDWNFIYPKGDFFNHEKNTQVWFQFTQVAFINLIAYQFAATANAWAQIDIDELIDYNHKLNPFTVSAINGSCDLLMQEYYASKVYEDALQNIPTTISNLRHQDHNLSYSCKEFNHNSKYIATPRLLLEFGCIYYIHSIIMPNTPRYENSQQKTKLEVHEFTLKYNNFHQPYKFYINHCMLLNTQWRSNNQTRFTNWFNDLSSNNPQTDNPLIEDLTIQNGFNS